MTFNEDVFHSGLNRLVTPLLKREGLDKDTNELLPNIKSKHDFQNHQKIDIDKVASTFNVLI